MLPRLPDAARKPGLAGLLLAISLLAAAPASGQNIGTTISTTTTVTTTTTPGEVEAPPPNPNAATILPDGRGSYPPGAPGVVIRAIRAANQIHTRPYIWGGGHLAWRARGYDCSGAVSYVLHAARLLSAPLVSGQLAHWGAPGPGNWITVYANREHTFMIIAGLRFDTSPVGESINQGRGPRWRYTIPYRPHFAVRHWPGL